MTWKKWILRQGTEGKILTPSYFIWLFWSCFSLTYSIVISDLTTSLSFRRLIERCIVMLSMSVDDFSDEEKMKQHGKIKYR